MVFAFLQLLGSGFMVWVLGGPLNIPGFEGLCRSGCRALGSTSSLMVSS